MLWGTKCFKTRRNNLAAHWANSYFFKHSVIKLFLYLSCSSKRSWIFLTFAVVVLMQFSIKSKTPVPFNWLYFNIYNFATSCRNSALQLLESMLTRLNKASHEISSLCIHEEGGSLNTASVAGARKHLADLLPKHSQKDIFIFHKKIVYTIWTLL